jgi:DNA-binding TFAR19-related protein (PDSD5 family)
MNSTVTTIKLDRFTRERLDKLRVYKRETFDEILNKMLDILNTCKLNPEKAKRKLIAIDKQHNKL